MTRDEFKYLYGRMCSAYPSHKPTDGEELEYFASLKNWTLQNAEKTFDEMKGTLVFFPTFADFKMVYAVIKQNELRANAPKPKVYNSQPDQMDINQRGIWLVNFVIYQQAINGRVAMSKIEGIETPLGVKAADARKAIDRLYKNGYATFWSKFLKYDYPYKSKIDELAKKEQL